ncbi:MAG: M23 family metallopeptidase, partial [Myxococcota bacterium]
IIQLAHCSDAQPPVAIEQCLDPFFTNYQHVDSVTVEVGQQVERGQVIGTSGASSSGFAHLHFELRIGSKHQRSSVHPLAYLPHSDSGAPDFVIDRVDFEDPAIPIVQATVTRPASELDFMRMEAELYAEDGRLLSTQAYDVNLWNVEYTGEEDPNEKLDNPYFNGVTVRPEPFGTVADIYEVTFRFRRMASDTAPEQVRALIRAVDVDGNEAVLDCSPCPP